MEGLCPLLPCHAATASFITAQSVGAAGTMQQLHLRNCSGSNITCHDATNLVQMAGISSALQLPLFIVLNAGWQVAQKQMSQLLSDEGTLGRVRGAPQSSVQTLAAMLALILSQQPSALHQAAPQETLHDCTRDALRSALIFFVLDMRCKRACLHTAACQHGACLCKSVCLSFASTSCLLPMCSPTHHFTMSDTMSDCCIPTKHRTDT